MQLVATCRKRHQSHSRLSDVPCRAGAHDVLQPRSVRKAVAAIRRGQRPPTPPAKTFNDVCDFWLEQRAPQKRSPAGSCASCRCIDSDSGPAWDCSDEGHD